MNRFKVLTNKSYIKKFQKIITKILSKLDDYLENPNEDNIHDIRISVRRLEAAYMVLPKKNRNQPVLKKYMKELKLLFKTNTEIRDFDIIITKLDQYFINQYFSKLVSTLTSKRKQKIRGAQNIASKLKAMPIPKINQNDISESKLKKRFHKTIYKFNTRINQNIPIVISDNNKIEELHRLRKDFKKLRYIIELTLENKNTPDIGNFKKIQDTLGEIHDSDIMLDYLKSLVLTNEIKDIIKQESIERNLKYKLFVKTFSKHKNNLKELICDA